MSVHEHSEVVPIRTQHVPQSIETPVTFVTAPGIYLRYAYSRSGDSMANHIDGQDYLCFQHNDQRFVFVICDGVGSSFCGNLAARILGDGLLEWLWSVDITYLGGEAALAEAATSALNRLQKQAKHEVDDYRIPDQIPPLVRQALEAQRTYGSEAVFVALRVDHPSPTIPDGLISLCWMGDSQMHVLDEQGTEIDIGGSWDNANRWSTTQGVRGRMSTWMKELNHVGRIVAFTDGLATHAAKITGYSDDYLDRQIRAGARMPTSDDVTFIDVVLRTPQYDGYPDPEMPDPNLERPMLDQVWNPTGVGTYELRWSWPGQPNTSFMIQEATNPALTDAQVMKVIAKEASWKPEKPRVPGHYYYRVRAVNRRGVVSPWSELRQTKVAYPPPPAPMLHPAQAGSTPTLNWEVEGDALDFALEYSINPGFEEPETVYSGRNSSWAVPTSSLPPGTYYFRVQAISDGGAGPWSEVQKVEITLPPPPRPHLATPGVPYAAGMRSYELRWQPVPGATHYELEQREQHSDAVEIITLADSTYRREDQEEGHYLYRVRACHDFGCGDWSNEQSVIISAQPPDAAPELAIDGPDEEGNIHLTWGDLESATAYEVEVSQSDTFGGARVIATDMPAADLIRREPGQVFFRARGLNTGGPGPWSAPVETVITPPTPEWIEASALPDGRLTVSWANTGGPAEYVVQLGGDRGASFVEIYRGENTQCEIDPGKPLHGAVLRVRAEAPGAASDWRDSPLISAEFALVAPTLDVVDSQAEGIRLHWNPVAGASAYVIEVARDEQFTRLHREETEKTTGTFHPPASGRYWFRVRAAQGNQAGPPSNIVSLQAQRPAAPSVWPMEPVKENALFDISWTGVPGCVYYELQGSGDPQFDPAKTSSVRVNHPSQKFTVPGRSKGVYYYRIRAVDENGQASMWSKNLTIEVI